VLEFELPGIKPSDCGSQRQRTACSRSRGESRARPRKEV
jgi:hypothetical protein